MNEISNKTILTMLFATLAISLGGTFVSLNAVNSGLTSVGLQPITGFALVPNGTATVTITTSSSIKFSQGTVAFGSGSVNTSGGYDNCTLSTLDHGVTVGSNSGCDGFNEVANGFTVENDGNTNLTVTARANKTATNFIGAETAKFLWNVTVNETGSCVNSSGTSMLVVEPNTTSDGRCGGSADDACGAIFENASIDDKIICTNLRYVDSSDALNIDINISIPDSAPAGAKEAGIVVTGTRNPTS
ncbi:hypothetical protein ISS07_01490 [Candidatus Woesearchaeota archaeon]|nr:hypothetical protein [Candidatus Woesearchaeota archaeon]